MATREEGLATTPGTGNRRVLIIGIGVTVLIAVAALLWSKWVPYTIKLAQISGTGAYPGSSILTVGGVEAGDPPSWGAALSFTAAYSSAVWKALLTALLIAAAMQTLVPRQWLLRVLDRPGRLGSAMAGGLASTPTMMCTCCTAPVAATLRRSGVRTAAVVAYWLGNPLLNPAVIAFLLVVAPWEWALTRLVFGVLLVVGGAVLVARLTGDRRSDDVTAEALTGAGEPEQPVAGGPGWQQLGVAYLRSLLKMSLILIPEYLVVVALVGAFRGWLFPIAGLEAGVLLVVLAAVLGTLLVIPTAGEIPILQGLALAGLAAGPIGALLITLPAVSLPGIAMVGRSFGWRVTTATTAVVMVGGALAGGALALIS